MKKLKVATVIGTRPEIVRLSRVFSTLDEYTDHTIIHTGQNYDYELNQIFFDDLDLRAPDRYLNAAGKNGAATIGNVIKTVDEALEEIQPDAMLVLGDTNSCMAVIPAKRRKIPTFHMEAGNRCFDMRVPEEINRRIVDHTADVNMTYSTIAREYLVKEGIPPELIIKTGSPMKEVLTHYSQKISQSIVLDTLSLKAKKYFVVSAHREENIDGPGNIQKLKKLLNAICAKYGLPIIVSTHPRTRRALDTDSMELDPKIQLLKPQSFSDYNCLQINSKAVLSDSGTINEESSILNFRALNIREAHERPEAMEETAVMMVGLEKDRVLQGLAILEKQPDGTERFSPIVRDYDVDSVSTKVVRIIISYVDYVNRTIWRKV